VITNSKISIVIPVHDEEAVLEASITSICQQLEQKPGLNWEILIVENGSRDQTLALAEKLSNEHARIQVLALADANYGAALQRGLLEVNGDLIVNFDVDYWDTEFVELVAHVMSVKYDIVIASKSLLLSRDQRGFTRKIATYIFRMMLFFMFGLRVSDTHGIKAWRNTEKLQRHFQNAKPSHHTYDTEVIIRAMRDGCEVLEIPSNVVETRASNRSLLKRVPEALREIACMFVRLNFSYRLRRK
jgi:glycosyltransferase involved in cell wall biosynthesis